MRCRKKDCFNCPYPDCINDYEAPKYELSEEQKKAKKDWSHNQYQTRKDNGLCVDCGKKPAQQGKVRCPECLRKNASNGRKYWRKKYDTLPRYCFDGISLCKTCGRREPVEGYKICEECLEKSKRALSIARNSVKVNRFAEAINRDCIMAKNKKQRC